MWLKVYFKALFELFRKNWNVIRNLAIGGLMMPLVTWVTSHVKAGKIADTSPLLTSFRTISGSIGSAVFVSIFSVVGVASVGNYGDSAMMWGLQQPLVQWDCMPCF
jgi:hypothetical protein